MESLRHQVLQAELTRIEQEAEAKSYAIMNKADALATAHAFCQLINKGVPEFEHFQPAVLYLYPTHGCDVVIYTHDNGDVLLRRARELGATWEDTGPAWDGTRRVRFDGVPGVDVFITDVALAMRACLDEAAA